MGQIRPFNYRPAQHLAPGVTPGSVWWWVLAAERADDIARKAIKAPNRLAVKGLGDDPSQLDTFGGAGTTYAVAERMHRNWIGIELGGIQPIIDRLTGVPANFEMPNRGDSGRGVSRRSAYPRNEQAPSPGCRFARRNPPSGAHLRGWWSLGSRFERPKHGGDRSPRKFGDLGGQRPK